MFGDDVLFLQRFLKAASCYDGPLSGQLDSATNVALQRFEDECDAIAEKRNRFDKRTEYNITTLVPDAQIAARNFMAVVKSLRA